MTGIGTHLIDPKKGPASALISFVERMVAEHLPASLGHEFGPDDFSVRIKEGEDELALEVIHAFSNLGQSGASLPGDLMNDAFGQFLADSFADEKELGQYLTPSEVVRFMVDLALDDLPEHEFDRLADPAEFANFGLVMDPSCGVGSFLAEFVRSAHSRLLAKGLVGQEWSAAASRDLVVGLDKSERMVRLALANLATFGADRARLHLVNSLARTGPDALVTASFEGAAGLILTNPPFGATFSASEVSDYRIATEWAKPASVDSELLFMERYVDWLRPGGQLMAIVPDSILTNRGLFAKLRKGLAPDIELRSVVSLPPVTFAAAGTTTKTSVIQFRRGKKSPTMVRFAVCDDVGFSVTKRQKVPTGSGQLPTILQAMRDHDPNVVVLLADVDEAERWDATFHGSKVGSHLADSSALVRVGEVASLSQEKLNPKRLPGEYFDYIEISDVNGELLTVSSKPMQTSSPPSRARQRVRTNDVLVSTVRPERGAVGVVNFELDGAICTTGFGVLRPVRIDPTVLAALLQTEFVRHQFIRNNVGIAYPAIDSRILEDIVLPATLEDLNSLQSAAQSYADAVSIAAANKQVFDKLISSVAGDRSPTSVQFPDLSQAAKPMPVSG